MFKKPLKIINFAVLLQQQRYIVAISYLFYLQNGLSLSDFLLFQSIFYFTGLIAEIPAGYLADIFPRKNVLIFSYLLFLARIIMWILLPNYWTILAGEVLYGLSKAFYRGTSDSYIYDYLKSSGTPNTMVNKYGKFNFYMSCGSATSCLIGAWLYKYMGFTVLLSIEMFCNSTAVFLLLFLPDLPQKKPYISLKKHIIRMFNIVGKAIQNTNLSIYMLFGSILSGITSVFVWNFQPIMKSFSIPVFVFGIVYFINHMLRALCSFNAHRILDKLSLEKIGIISWLMYVISFILMFKLIGYADKTACMAIIIFVCIAIGIQMIFNVGNISRIHKLIPQKARATMSSVNFMLTGLFSGILLITFKHFAVNNSAQNILYFVVIFIFLIVLAKKMSEKTS